MESFASGNCISFVHITDGKACPFKSTSRTNDDIQIEFSTNLGKHYFDTKLDFFFLSTFACVDIFRDSFPTKSAFILKREANTNTYRQPICDSNPSWHETSTSSSHRTRSCSAPSPIGPFRAANKNICVDGELFRKRKKLANVRV